MDDGEREETGERRPRKLSGLLHDVVDLVPRLIREEIRATKAEIVGKLKAAGVGAGLVVGGVVVVLFAIGFLLGAAVSGLHLVLPLWLSQLIVGAALVVLAVVLLLVGVAKLKRGAPPVPTESIDRVKDDVRVLKGTRRETTTTGKD